MTAKRVAFKLYPTAGERKEAPERQSERDKESETL